MPAWIAFSVVRLLEEHFTRQISYEFTAGMEDVLDEIAAGRADRVTELGEFYFGSDRVVGLHMVGADVASQFQPFLPRRPDQRDAGGG